MPTQTLTPSLTLITGRPGAGKTTLARALAAAVRCPLLCRDEVKEGLVHSLPPGTAVDDEIQRLANDAFFDAIELLLRRGVTLMAEAAFQHHLWAPRLELLRGIANLRIIVCSVDPTLARSRHIERGLADPQRERFHGDAVVAAAREGRTLPIGDYVPPNLDLPTLVVDTSDGYRPGLDEVVAFARREDIGRTPVSS
jgi:predicted kinase